MGSLFLDQFKIWQKNRSVYQLLGKLESNREVEDAVEVQKWSIRVGHEDEGLFKVPS